MVKVLEEIANEPILLQMCRAAKMPRNILFIDDEFIGYYRPSYNGSTWFFRPRLRNLFKKDVLKRKEDTEVDDLVYEEAVRIKQELRGIRNPDGELADLGVVCLSDRVYDALNKTGDTIAKVSEGIFPHIVKRYKREEEVHFKLYKAPEFKSLTGKAWDLGKGVLRSPMTILDMGYEGYKVASKFVSYFF